MMCTYKKHHLSHDVHIPFRQLSASLEKAGAGNSMTEILGYHGHVQGRRTCAKGHCPVYEDYGQTQWRYYLSDCSDLTFQKFERMFLGPLTGRGSFTAFFLAILV